jgi:signal transduction histidine kinase
MKYKIFSLAFPKFLSLRLKLILMLVLALAMAVTPTSFLLRAMFYNSAIDQKMTTANIFMASLVHDVKYDFKVGNIAPVNAVIQKYVTYYREIEEITFYDRELRVAASSNNQIIGDPATDPRILAALQQARPTKELTDEEDHSLSIFAVSPVLRGSRIEGAVVLKISNRDLLAKFAEMDVQALSTLAGTLLVSILSLYFWLRSGVLLRIQRLDEATREVAAGNYEVTVSDAGRDELGHLTTTFNNMVADLKKSKQELTEYHRKNLEQKVEDATNELKRAYLDLQGAQAQIVLKEKMASLGVLIAGIAHEINTPIGAIQNVSQSLGERVARLPSLVVALNDAPGPAPAEIQACLDEVVQQAAAMSELPSYLELAEVEDLLRDAGVEDWHEMTDSLAAINLARPLWIQKHLSCLRSDPVFHLLEQVGGLIQAATIARLSAAKIGEIIKALKYYAYTDKAKVEPTDINESVRTALVLLNNKLKYAVKVTTEFADDLPLIPCTSEIHQIWTNLLSNACDAIEEAGEGREGAITVRTSYTEGHVVVRVIDNGVGIPEDLKQKVFDPFFTTKDIGKGTGLGLAIVAGIIKKHDGRLEVASQPGHTCFAVWLAARETQTRREDSKNTLEAQACAA